MDLCMKFPSQRQLYLLGFIATCLMLGVIAYLQAFEGFTPCPLCILQRFVLALLGSVFFLGALIKLKKTSGTLIGLTACLISGLGVFLAGRQVWLQRFPSPDHTDCGASLEYMLHAFPLREVLNNVLKGSAECTQVSWQFLNLSLADWSLLGFIALLILSFAQLCQAQAR